MNISIPELALVILIGPSGSGKSTFAGKHFKQTEILSSDYCRSLVSDDENDQSATKNAFEVLHFIVAKRLAAGRLTVIDATNVLSESRKQLIKLARDYHCFPVAIVFNVPEKLCLEQNMKRIDRQVGDHVIHHQYLQMSSSLLDIESEGLHEIIYLSPEEIAEVTIERRPLWNNLKHEHGPFDIIGDVHGCFDELCDLLRLLGYRISEVMANDQSYRYEVCPPEGRKAVFLGDLVDRGPKIPQVLSLVMSMIESGVALCVPGNHDIKLMRKLRGREVKVSHGLAQSLSQLEKEPKGFKDQVAGFIERLTSHYQLDEGKLVVAHAGLKEELQGRGSRKVRDFALYGEVTGEINEYGLPVRHNWAAEYRGRAMVVYGHTPVHKPEWLNLTINIDTGCVFGGKLTALRYPEGELVSVDARQIYYRLRKPFLETRG
jgi:protein phosphatase